MLWVLYSLISAFSFATADALTKKASVGVDEYILNLSRFLYASPFVLLLLIFIPIPKLSISFGWLLILTLAIEVLAQVLYIKAIRSSPLSLVVPLLSLTSVFLIFTSFVILGELPTVWGFFGILLVVIGAYILNLNDSRKGVFEPFKSVLKEKGSIYMIVVAFLFSITSNLGKILAQKSSPLFFSAIYIPLLALSFGMIALFTSRKKIAKAKLNFKSFSLIGLFLGLSAIFHMLAVMLVIVPYMISVKRTSLIFSVIYGHFMFGEKNIKERLTGTIFMLMGIILITLS